VLKNRSPACATKVPGAQDDVIASPLHLRKGTTRASHPREIGVRPDSLIKAIAIPVAPKKQHVPPHVTILLASSMSLHPRIRMGEAVSFAGSCSLQPSERQCLRNTRRPRTTILASVRSV
jgi:hypothetical protein